MARTKVERTPEQWREYQLFTMRVGWIMFGHADKAYGRKLKRRAAALKKLTEQQILRKRDYKRWKWGAPIGK